MRSLFLKILLWFGVAMVLVNVASFVTGVFIERRSQNQRNNPVVSMYGLYAETAAEVFESGGREALASYLSRVESASGIRAVVFDERGAEISGREVPAGAKELAARTSEGEPFISTFPSQPSLAARMVRGPRGARYTLVGQTARPEFPRPPPRLGEPGSFAFGLRMLGQSLLPLLLVGALFCYWLARYMTTPLVKLRETTQKLADGNLKARVSGKLMKRRDEIGSLGRDFNMMAGRIESLVEAQQRLLRDISHELRSPLTRLNVALELVRRRATPELCAGLDRIEREAGSINEMIGQLLTLSRAESSASRLEGVRVDLGALVEEVADDADFEARSRNRSVRLTARDECAVTGVAELLRSAVENVVRNALRHTAEGTEVEIALRREDQDGARHALITVRDHGAGVPEEDIRRIFHPFYRVEDARDRQTGGTGLGLAIATRAVKLHGGTIEAANAPDGGLVVELRFPVAAELRQNPNVDEPSETTLAAL